MPNQNITPAQINFLNRLNNFLIKKEIEIRNKAAFYKRILRKELVKSQFTNDFEVEIKVTYYELISSESEDEIELHKYIFGFELLKDKRDWREESSIHPKLENRYCYLMHDLCYHSNLNIEQLCTIGTVWIDLRVLDQSIVNKGVEGF